MWHRECGQSDEYYMIKELIKQNLLLDLTLKIYVGCSNHYSDKCDDCHYHQCSWPLMNLDVFKF